ATVCSFTAKRGGIKARPRVFALRAAKFGKSKDFNVSPRLHAASAGVLFLGRERHRWQAGSGSRVANGAEQCTLGDCDHNYRGNRPVRVPQGLAGFEEQAAL